MRILLILILLWSGVVFAEELPDELKYNALEGEWSYERPDAELDYNELEGEFQWKERGESERYNPMTGKWEFAR